MTERSALVGSLIVAVAATLFGLLGVLSRTAYDLGLSPFAFVAWRAGVGALVVGAFLVWLAGRQAGAFVAWSKVPGRARLALLVAALMGSILNLSMFVAFDRAPVAIVLLGFYLYPAIVAGASAVMGWEPLDRWRASALVIALGGMVAVVLGGQAAGGPASLDALGVALSLVAAVTQAVFVLVSRHGYPEVPTIQAMTTVLAVAAVVAGAIAIAMGGPPAIALPFGDATLLGLLLFTGLFGAAIPSSMFLTGIRRIGAIRAGILMLIEPLVGAALAALFLAEAIGPLQALGGAAILVAAVIIQRSQRADPAIVPAAEPEPVDVGHHHPPLRRGTIGIATGRTAGGATGGATGEATE